MVIVGLVLTAVCFFLYVSGSNFVADISNMAYDAFLQRAHVDPKTDSVAIVDLDDPSLNKYGQWPWPRYLVADLTRKILEEGASVVAFDIVFAEKDRTSPAQVKRAMEQKFNLDLRFDGLPENLYDFDKLFADVLSQAKTILGCFMWPVDKIPVSVDLSIDPFYRETVRGRTRSQNKELSLNKILMQSSGLTIAIPDLNSASATAFFNAVPDSDNIVRRNPLVWSFGGERIYPSLALEALRMHLNIPACLVKYDDQGVSGIELKDIFVPTDSQGRVVINYRTVRKDSRTGFASSFPTYSAQDVMENKLPAGVLAGKIVFIGTSAVGLKDVKATPLTSEFSGVEVHATIVDNILSRDVLQNPTLMIGVQAVAIVFMGIFLTVFINRGRSWLSFIISLAMILISIKLSLVLITEKNLVFVPVWIILTIFIIYPVLTMIKFWQEELQKKHVRDMFGTMVSANVLHYLENHPGSFSLSGRHAEATMFFSDVAGFTTISESLKPEALSHLLNRYLSPMTEIIMEHGGYVDKYEGDLIMAEWGVPYPMQDHAVQGCMAALEQQIKLTEIRANLKAEFGHDIVVRMGINSGVVAAGNMGSDRRMQYTVMGDAVNQAARFEPTNKDYDTLIIIGESTYEEAKHAVETRLLDRILVAGKTRPITIYELLAMKGALSATRRDVIDLYQQALHLHWERKWDQALSSVDRALALDPRDGPSVRMRQRIEDYRQNPPPETWTGEYVRKSKD